MKFNTEHVKLSKALGFSTLKNTKEKEYKSILSAYYLLKNKSMILWTIKMLIKLIMN